MALINLNRTLVSQEDYHAVALIELEATPCLKRRFHSEASKYVMATELVEELLMIFDDNDTVSERGFKVGTLCEPFQSYNMTKHNDNME